MILGNMTGNYLAVSSATFLVGMTGFFWKCEKTFSHLGKRIRMLQINLHPFPWVRQVMLRCTEDRLMQNPSLLQTATVRTPLLGLHLPSLSLHFVANALCLHIFTSPGSPATSQLDSFPLLPHHHQWKKPNTLHYVQPHDVQIQFLLTFYQLCYFGWA